MLPQASALTPTRTPLAKRTNESPDRPGPAAKPQRKAPAESRVRLPPGSLAAAERVYSSANEEVQQVARAVTGRQTPTTGEVVGAFAERGLQLSGLLAGADGAPVGYYPGADVTRQLTDLMARLQVSAEALAQSQLRERAAEAGAQHMHAHGLAAAAELQRYQAREQQAAAEHRRQVGELQARVTDLQAEQEEARRRAASLEGEAASARARQEQAEARAEAAEAASARVSEELRVLHQSAHARETELRQQLAAANAERESALASAASTEASCEQMYIELRRMRDSTRDLVGRAMDALARAEALLQVERMETNTTCVHYAYRC